MLDIMLAVFRTSLWYLLVDTTLGSIMINFADCAPMEDQHCAGSEAVRIRNYKQLAITAVPRDLAPLLPTSFDIVGDIAVVKIPKELEAHSDAIGKAILGAYKNIKVVASDSGVMGPWRQRTITVITGEQRTLTVHKEYGMVLEVDIAEAYFSPRLANERWRIAQLVGDGEYIIDAFAGVGPFSVLIARKAKPVQIIAIDINPAAYTLMEHNIKRNKTVDIVKPVLGDSAVELPRACQSKKADRIIMNLPWKSFDYLTVAFGCITNGGTIHFYEINDKDKINRRENDIVDAATAMRLSAKVKFRREIKSYSPSQSYYVMDILVTDQ